MSRRILLHVCCGPCGTSTHAHWRGTGAEVVGFFYNPNIQPLMEYRRRLHGVRELGERVDMQVVEDLYYDPTAWFSEVCSSERTRCAACIAMRMERTALEAATLGCEAFTTTLAVSPWQDHEAIQSAGVDAGARHGVAFLYRDLRSLYPESRRLSRDWGLYRQKYCGCLVSEWERYRDS